MTYAEMIAHAEAHGADTLFIWSESGADTGVGTAADATKLIADGIFAAEQVRFRVA